MTYEHPWYSEQQRLANTTNLDSQSQQKPSPETTGRKSTKRCQICKEYLPLNSFGKARNRSDGLFPECRSCANKTARVRAAIKKTAPPKPDVCDCCKNPVENWVMDHNHDTEKFRGWLCRNCNMAIGKLGDNLEGVMKAVNYLSTNV